MNAYVTGSCVSNNTVKNEVTMQVIKWTVSTHKSKKAYKLNTIDKPSVQTLGAYAFIPREDYHQDAWLSGGREVQLRSNSDDLALARTLGSVDETALEETNMFQTDARDLAADREAEEHEDNFDCYGEKEVSSMDSIFKENEKLIKCREGHQTYGYCAWCDAPIGNPNKLWKHYLDQHQVLMQVAPMSPPSVWQTLMGREMGARTPQFQTPQGQYKYWVQPAKGDGIDSFVIGSTQRGNETLVSLGELLLAGNGALPLVAISPATKVLSPRQKPPNCVKVALGGTDYWTKVKLYDMNTLLSIGTPVTSDMAFLTMFSEWGNILGGKLTGRGEYSSEELYGIRRYPDTLRMMSQGKPASEPDVKSKSEDSSAPKPLAPSRAASDSGISDPTKEQDKSAAPKASSTAGSQSIPPPKPTSMVTSTTTGSDPLPKAKESSDAALMPAPPVKPKTGSESGGPSATRAPSGAASQSTVTTGSGYPTIAESLGKSRSPPLKAAPSSLKASSAPSSKSADTGPAAAKGSTSAPSEDKDEKTSQPPLTTTTSKGQEVNQPARASRAPDVQAPVEKDAAMTYTEQVMRQAASAVPTSKLTDEEYERLAQERWKKMLIESATSASHRATSVAHLPREL